MCLRVCVCVELIALVLMCIIVCVCVCVCVQVCVSQFDRYEIEFKITLPLSFIQVLAQGYTDFSLNLKTARFPFYIIDDILVHLHKTLFFIRRA